MATIEVKAFTFKAVMALATRQENIQTGEKTTYNKDTGMYTSTVTVSTNGTEYTGTGVSSSEGEAYQSAKEQAILKAEQAGSGLITVSTFGDGVFIRDDKYPTPGYTIESATQTAQGNIFWGGIYDMTKENYYVQAQEAPKPTPKAPPPPPVEPQKVYYPKSRYTEPKSASPGEFVIKSTQEEYKGTYVETFNSKYYGGSSPLDTGIELEKVKEPQAGLDEGRPNYFGILAESAGGFFQRLLTKAEKSKGVAKRYFVQDKNTNKIVETDKANFLQTQQQVMSRRFLEVDWIVKGPADDRVFRTYKYEGAASKNKKTIQALEKQMPGISTFIKDYGYLVEQPVAVVQQNLTTQTIVEKDVDVSLENSRKANFDTRK